VYRIILDPVYDKEKENWRILTNKEIYASVEKPTTVCPTHYRAWHFFNNFTTNEDIATTFEMDYRHNPLHFSHNKCTPVHISLQYLHWC